MQKLVTIYIDVSGYERKSGLRISYGDMHGRVQEHLQDYLSNGWRILHLNCFRGPETGGWIVAAIEKDEAQN